MRVEIGVRCLWPMRKKNNENTQYSRARQSPRQTINIQYDTCSLFACNVNLSTMKQTAGYTLDGAVHAIHFARYKHAEHYNNIDYNMVPTLYPHLPKAFAHTSTTDSGIL